MYSQYQAMDDKLKQLWAGAEDSHRRAVQLSCKWEQLTNCMHQTTDTEAAQTDSMKTMISNVVGSIGKAISALQMIISQY